MNKEIGKRRLMLLIDHADNGNPMRANTLEARLKEFSALRRFSRPRATSNNPYPETFFRIIKYRSGCPRKLFTNTS